MKKPSVVAAVITAMFLSPVLISQAANHDHKEENKEQSKSPHQHEYKQDKLEKDHDEDEHGHDEEKKDADEDEHGHGEEKTHAELTDEQIKQAGIETIVVQKQSVSRQIIAPAEVRLNQYRTSKIAPKLTAQVKKRYVQLGDQVKKGQKLATLQAVTTPELAANMISMTDLEAGLAEAQGELRIAQAEWQRMSAIGKDLISAKRIDEAKINRDQATAKVKTYRQSQKKMRGILSSGSSRIGSLEIIAPQSGTIISDNFVNGQVVEAGEPLFEISDIDRPWVVARIKPAIANHINKNASTTIKADGQKLQGKVINVGKILDEKTRTLAIRIELNKGGEVLYPGQFVQTHIDSSENHSGLTVPSEAVLRSPDGDWMVLLETEDNKFAPKEVEIKQDLGDMMIIEGIDAGSKIVSKGAFFVQSEIAKSGFDIHNH